METSKQKKKKLIKRSDLVSAYAIGSLQRELGASQEIIKEAISAVGNHPDKIYYYVRTR